MPKARLIDAFKHELNSAFYEYELYLGNKFPNKKRQDSEAYRCCHEELEACRQMMNRFGEFDIVALRKAVEAKAKKMTLRARWYQFHITDYLWPLRILLYSKLEQHYFSLFNLMEEEIRILKERPEGTLRKELNEAREELQSFRNKYEESQRSLDEARERLNSVKGELRIAYDENIKLTCELQNLMNQLTEVLGKTDATQFANFQPLAVSFKGNIQTEMPEPTNKQDSVVSKMSHLFFSHRR